MSKYFLVAAIFLAVTSCRKEAVRSTMSSGDYYNAVLSRLKDSLSAPDYRSLDTRALYFTPAHDGNPALLRIPFQSKPIAGDFVLLATDTLGNIFRGRIVHLVNDNPGDPFFHSGEITVTALTGLPLLQSGITDGFINAFHPARSGQVSELGTNHETVVPESDGAQVLPEVVVVGYTGGSSGDSYVYLDLLIPGGGSGGAASGSGGGSGGSGAGGGGGAGGGSGSSGSGATYSSLNPGGGSSGAPPSGVVITQPVSVAPDYANTAPIINLTQYFNAFNTVNSTGATYTITLCTDVPVNSNPQAIVEFSGGTSAGHSFLIATKSNAALKQSVTQVFGFYPAQAPPATNITATVPSAIKDNGAREINASITTTVTPSQFAAFQDMALNLTSHTYSLVNFNCTDYALNCFNTTQTTPLVLQPIQFDLPGLTVGAGYITPGTTITLNNSPQMLFAALNAMKTKGGSAAGGIVIDLSGNTKAPSSYGPAQ